MVRRLQAEIRQTKPFPTLEAEAYLNLLRTADALFRGGEALLKPLQLSPPQYNVLRILRGAYPGGLACREVAERLLTKDPDITRLMDRLEHRGLITRARDQKDRRVITTRITPDGLRLLKQLDTPMLEMQEQQLGHLGQRKLRYLINLLETVRQKAR